MTQINSSDNLIKLIHFFTSYRFCIKAVSAKQQLQLPIDLLAVYKEDVTLSK